MIRLFISVSLRSLSKAIVRVEKGRTLVHSHRQILLWAKLIVSGLSDVFCHVFECLFIRVSLVYDHRHIYGSRQRVSILHLRGVFFSHLGSPVLLRFTAIHVSQFTRPLRSRKREAWTPFFPWLVRTTTGGVERHWPSALLLLGQVVTQLVKINVWFLNERCETVLYWEFGALRPNSVLRSSSLFNHERKVGWGRSAIWHDVGITSWDLNVRLCHKWL